MTIRLERRKNYPGIIADIRVRHYDGRFFRERRRVPRETEEEALKWAKKREAYLERLGPDAKLDTRPRSPRGQAAGWVYFVRGPKNRIKIGWALDPTVRLAELQTGCPTKLVLLGVDPGTISDERALHAQFANLRESGEWFRPGAELLEHIRRSTQVPPNASRCPRLPAPRARG